MRVLLISTSAIPTPPSEVYGGIEWIQYWLAEGLSNAGHEVAIVGLQGSKGPNEKVKVYEAWGLNEKYADVLIADRIGKIIEDFKPDIISDASHEKRSFPVAQKMKIPFIPNCHTQGIPDFGVSNPCWTALSKAHAAFIKKNYGVTARVCYNGISSTARSVTRQKAKIGNLIFVGRPNPEKGALEVVDMCKRNNLPLDVIAGRLEIEPIAYALLLAQQCKIYGKQVYHGGVSYDKKMQMLAQSKGFLFFPNWEEPFGLTPVEAGWVGTPAIVNDMGAMSEIVEDGKTGFVIPVQRDENGNVAVTQNRYGFYRTIYDEQKVLDAIAKLSSLDLDYITQHVRDKFSITRMTEGYLNVFNDKLDGKEW